MKKDRVIVNKKSVKTTKKKDKAEAEQEENNLVKFSIDNLQFNLTLDQITISKFNEITPVSIEFSDHPFSHIDESTKNETSKELQRVFINFFIHKQNEKKVKFFKQLQIAKI